MFDAIRLLALLPLLLIPCTPSAAAKSDLDRLKSLAGEWTVVTPSDEDAGLRATYTVIAGGSAVLEFLLAGTPEETRVLPRRIKDIPEFAVELEGGTYGKVIERTVGERWTRYAVAVEWDLLRFEGKPLRLYVVDAATNHFGQIAISEISIMEKKPAR